MSEKKATEINRKPAASETAPADPIRQVLQRLGLARSKETVKATGLDRGGYMQIAHAQLDALMLPNMPPLIRYYAWLLRATIGYALERSGVNSKGRTSYHGRCAMKMERGRKVPASMTDAAKDLFMDKGNVHRCQKQLEELRWARRATDKTGRVLLFCYIRPWDGANKEQKPVVDVNNRKSVSNRGIITCSLPMCKGKMKVFYNLSPYLRPAVVDANNPPIPVDLCKSIIEEELATMTKRIGTALAAFAVVKPARKRLSTVTTPYRKKGTERNAAAIQQQQPAESAAAAAPTTNWPKTMTAAQKHYPKVGQPFLDRLLTKAQQIRPLVTDDELAGALTIKPGQRSEGFWIATVGESMQMLNEKRPAPETGMSLRDRVEAAIQREKEKGK